MSEKSFTSFLNNEKCLPTLFHDNAYIRALNRTLLVELAESISCLGYTSRRDSDSVRSCLEYHQFAITRLKKLIIANRGLPIELDQTLEKLIKNSLTAYSLLPQQPSETVFKSVMRFSHSMMSKRYHRLRRQAPMSDKQDLQDIIIFLNKISQRPK